jgi:protein involved in temperature-dependent protein secretion
MHDEDVAEGTGQRIFATDQNEYSLLQIRSIEFDE